jgi:outer membrane protein OmpA-like peptidoglycan-associated protein
VAPRGPDGAPAPVRDAERLRVLPEEEAGGRAPRRIDDLRRQRQERREGDALVIREPGRTIIRQNDRFIIERDETQRFRGLGLRGEVERRGEFNRTVFVRPDGTRVITVTDDDGRLVRRLRQRPGGEEIVIIDNTRRERRGSGRYGDEVIVLERAPLNIPRERYILEADEADEGDIYETITAEPIARLPRTYTLDEVRYSPDLRARMRSVDINTITFETGSWTLGPAQARQLAAVAQAILRAVEASPQEVFLIEGHTDAVGAEIDNLSLSDRRAQAVAEALSRDFSVPPENLTTQGYGEQYLKVATQGPSRENRRVTLRRITPLLNQQGQAPQ